MLLSLPEGISKQGLIHVALSDHQQLALGKLVELKLEVCTNQKSNV